MPPQLTPEQRQAFADDLYAGRKIAAVRRLREISGLDLKGSKDIIDRLEAELRAEHPERFAVANKSRLTGCIVVVFLLALTGVALYYFFLR